MLSATRDAAAAERFFRQVLQASHTRSPRVITVDKNAAYPLAFEALQHDGTLPETCLLRQCKYLNNVVEQDHRAVKRVTRPMLGFKSFEAAQAYVATNKNNEALLVWLSASGATDIQQWGMWTAALIGRYPSQPMAFYLRADALARAEDLATAQALLSEAITHQPDFGLAYNARGVIAVLRGQHDRAQVDFHLATRVAPQLADAWANLGTLGVLYEYSLQQGEEALTAFHQAIALNPAFALAYNGRGALYFGAGEFDKAAEDFVAAAQILPPLLMAEVNKALAFHYALQTLTLASMAEDAPGTSLRALMQQYPEALKGQVQQLHARSSHPDLLRQDFAFRLCRKFSCGDDVRRADPLGGVIRRLAHRTVRLP
jgi:tetratricopeptide (TPR) repeat protein